MKSRIVEDGCSVESKVELKGKETHFYHRMEEAEEAEHITEPSPSHRLNLSLFFSFQHKYLRCRSGPSHTTKMKG